MKNLLQTLQPDLKDKLDLMILQYPHSARTIVQGLEATDNVYDVTFLTMATMQKFLSVNLDDFYFIFEPDVERG